MNLPEFTNISEKEKGYLLGLFLGDGYASYYEKEKRHRIDFTLNSIKDKDIQEYLILILKKANLSHCLVKDKRFNANYIRISGHSFFFYLHELSNAFSSNLRFFNKDFLLGVLSGFIDAEGCIYNGTILITQKSGLTIKRMQDICKIFGINCTLKEKKNYPEGYIWRGFVSTSFKYLPHVSQKVRREYGCLT